ncbi:MAG: sigma factor [Pirellulaceae bacterium]|jgi:DNA-directed RNA polymerase specialized sigma24 family protein|nr:sigma factor [Pirellulaceae bacterium]MDP7014353.1 sigma factor [Pirellulaceae bacterium]
MTTSPKTTTDSVTGLLQLYAADPDAGLRALLEKFGGRVRRYLCRQFGGALDDNQIDEALLEAAWRLPTTFDADRGKALDAWLLFLADREAINLVRREERHHRRRSDSGQLDCVECESDVELSVLESDLMAHVRRKIDTHLSHFEAAVVTADIEAGGGVPAAQLAADLDSDVNKIYAARARARRKLARELDGLCPQRTKRIPR